ncbi:MAG: hypothetical protein JWL76_1740 [Thermoleophilia bacterium]|nr:hypothetical protein [Thermoleophilia bacterium]
MELELGPLRFGIVGAGRLGLTIGRALQQQGFELVHVAAATADGSERATHVLGVPSHDDPVAASQQVDCLLLCVPDDALAGVVARLAGRPDGSSPIRLRIVSTSALGGIDVLAPLAAAGHDVGVLHPVASVADHHEGPDALAGAGAAIGATDEPTRTFLHALAHALSLRPFDLGADAGTWALHAACCTLAANGPAVLLAAVDDLAAEASMHEGVARGAYGRLAASAVERAVRSGPVESLAGPIVRGDAAAVAAQVAAVRASGSQADALFIPIVATAANQAFTAGRLGMDGHRAVLEAILDPSQFAPEGPPQEQP